MSKMSPAGNLTPQIVSGALFHYTTRRAPKLFGTNSTPDFTNRPKLATFLIQS